MEKTTFDPGLTQKYTGDLRRSINKDGTFNVHRRGETWRNYHPYLLLLNVSWRKFFAIIITMYLTVNFLFACAYYMLGPGALQGDDVSTESMRFLSAFFFSTQTLTTVGYGGIHPKTIAANFLSSMEAIVGLMAFALGTGLLFGRFSRPSARIGFSQHLIIAPYQEGTSLQVRLVNLRPNILMDLEAHLLLMTVEGPPNDLRRRYQELRMERENVYFMPLTWTVVHPIDSQSPLFGKTADDLADLRAEVLVLVKAFDDTFSQVVNARGSYRHDEFVWQARFEPAFRIDSAGDMILDVDRVGDHVRIQG